MQEIKKMTRRGNRKKLSTRIKEKAMGNRGYRGTGLFNCHAFPSYRNNSSEENYSHTRMIKLQDTIHFITSPNRVFRINLHVQEK